MHTIDLTIFFNAVDEQILEERAETDSWQQNLHVNFAVIPDWQTCDIAIIGVPEDRGTHTNSGAYNGPDEIRKSLYRLKKGNHPYKIADLGNLRPGLTLTDTYQRISEVCEMVLQHGVIPILIGGSHDLDYGLYLAHQNLPMRVSLLNVDASLDMSDSVYASMSERHLHEILVHEPNYLFTFSHLAYQSYLTSPHDIAILERLYFESYRLGQVRDSIEDMEPIIREASMMSFDISAIRMSDAPGNANAHAFGLSGEEACQICWYAGLNEKMTSVGFFEYNPHYDQRRQTAEVVATMIWYFVEGFYHRKREFDFNDTMYTRYVVPIIESYSQHLVFYKNTLTEKWWMEVPYPGKPEKYSVVPCSYKDYQTALKGELPQRWINRYAKLG
jgi:formiminoglutamase